MVKLLKISFYYDIVYILLSYYCHLLTIFKIRYSASYRKKIFAIYIEVHNILAIQDELVYIACRSFQFRIFTLKTFTLNGIKDLAKQVIADSSKKCSDYDVDVVDFFNAENYYNNLINSFENSTAVSPDLSGDKTNFISISKPINIDKLKNLSKQYNISKEKLLLSAFMFDLTKFSFSKDILVLDICLENIHFKQNA